MIKQSGIALLPVAIIITIVAAVSLLLSYESSMNVNETASQFEAKQADLVAEAGMAHAKWQLLQNTNCTAYTNITNTNFDTHSYSASVAPNSGSPIQVSVNGVTSEGISRTLVDSHMRMYQTPFSKEIILDNTGQDSFIEGETGHLDHNKGSNQHIIIKSETNKPERGLLQFDLTSIPANTKIMSAELGLYLDESKGNSQEIYIHRLTDDWEQDEVTWEVKRSGFFQNWSPQGGEYVANVSGSFIVDAVGWYSAEITQLIQDWVKVPSINQGMILLSNPASGNNEKKFASSDNDDATLHPKLTITYACECGQVCVNPALSNLLMVVGDPDKLDGNETIRKDLIESWGYSVLLIDESASQEKYDEAVAESNVAYVSALADHSKLQDKLVNTSIGVVYEQYELLDSFGMAEQERRRDLNVINIVNNTHYITSVFPTGELVIYSGDEPSYTLEPEYASGLQILGQMNSDGWQPALTVVNTNAGLFGGGTAAGRRVTLPWENLDFSSINADGQTLMRRTLAWGAGAGEEETISNLIAHWKLDESSGLIAVESINGFDGGLQNNPEWEAAGRIDGALFFDNVNAQVVVPHSDLLSPEKALTLSAWVYNDAASLVDSYRIISKESLGANDNYFLAMQSNSLFLGIGGSFFNPAVSLSANQWYHIVATFDDDADEVRMYIDGIEVLSEATNASLTPNTDDLYIGSNWEEYKWWEGLIDDVRLYDRALTFEEIDELFQSAPTEDGGGGELKQPPEPPSDSCVGNYLDEFNQRVYSGSDGSLNWSTEWIEINESNGPTSGDEQVRSDLGHDYVLRIRDNDGGGEGVQRQADLSAYKTATLKFLYSRDSLDDSNDYVAVEVTHDGIDWKEIERIAGPGTDNTYFLIESDISSYISSTTSIRFLTSSTMGNTDTVYIDNVEVEVSGCVD